VQLRKLQTEHAQSHIRSLRKILGALSLWLVASAAIGGPIRDLAPGMWYEIPNSKLRSVVPNPAPDGDPVGIIDAWGGGAYDTDREQLIVWGGGHVDYAGNEVYTFGPMTSDTPTWTRRSNPSAAAIGCSATYADGKPRSTHTYNTLVYDPTVQKLVSMGLGSVYNCGSEQPEIFAFDMVANQWDAASAHPATNGGAQGSSASFDSSSGLIWRRGNLDRPLQSFDTSTNVLTNYDDGLGKMNIDFSTAIDPQRRIMVAIGGYNGVGPLDDGSVKMIVWDLSHPGTHWIPTSTGGASVESGTKLAFQFHPPTGTFIVWHGGTDVWRLTPPADLRNGTWVWDRIAAAAGSPTPGSENDRGTYGRFRYIPSLDLFMVVNSIDTNVFVYRLSNSSTVSQPSITFQAMPSAVGLQGSSTLSWSVTNADTCTASGGWSGTKALTGSETVGPLSASTTYVLGCTNAAGGSASRSLTVTVDGAAPAPTLTLSANPTTIPSGQTSVLSWTTSNATSCTATGGWSGSKATLGSQTVGPLSATTSYSLQCTGSGGTVSRSVTVTVSSSSPPAPTVTLTANPTSVASAGSSMLTWSSTNATSCTASGAWSGTKSASGNESTGALTSTASYTLNCSGSGGSVERTVTVTVSAATEPPPQSDSGGGGSLQTDILTLLGIAWILRAMRRNTLSRTRHATAMVRSILVLGVAVLIGTGCATAPTFAGDVASFKVISTSSSAQANVPVTLGYVFRPGDFPAGAGMGARLSSGTIIPLQVDKKATHNDGSLRHAILSVRVPTLAANGTETVTLTTAASSPLPPIALSSLLASGFDARVDLTVGSTTYSASAANLLGSAQNVQWLAGPVVSEWIVGGPVKDGSGNAHPHLAAYFHVRAYTGLDAVRVDVVIENNWSYVPSPGNFTYNAAISVGGQNRFSQSGLQHYHHARWHKVFWWGINQPAVNVQHDKAYLISTKAVPMYQPLVPTSGFLAGLATAVPPMSNGQLETYMPDGGPSADIGPLPAWSTAYLLTEDNRARLSTLANGDAGGAYSVHFRNDRTSDASYRYPISIIDEPSAGYGTGGDFPMGGSNPFTADTAHQPSVAYLPYLITGDYFYLEELQFWVDFNWLGDEQSVNCRQQARGLLQCHQERGQAWALRELARAAYITPDDHPLKSYFNTELENNRQWYTDAYINGTVGTFKNVFGALDRGSLGTDSGRQETKTWMDDFFTWAVGHVLELDYTSWRPLLDYKAKFVVGRLANPAFCYILAGTDTIDLASGPRTDWFTDWSTVYNTSFPASITGTACGSQAMADAISAWDTGTYNFQAGEIYNWASLAGSRLAIMYAATSILIDNGITGGDTAWARIRSSTVQPDWTEFANFALQPRGTVAPPPTDPPPSLTLSASPTSISANQGSTLTWSTQNATGCSASGGWSGSKAVSGSQSVGPLTTTTSYAMQCTGSGGTVSRSVTVTVTGTPPPPGSPTVTVTANPTSVASGGSSTLTWSSTNATSCTASGAWSGTKSASGNESTGALTSTASYTLNCSGSGGSVERTVTVTVTGGVQPPTDPGSDSGGGGSLDLYWLALFALLLGQRYSSLWRRCILGAP
jgi:hypothetical protein